ncbi:MAG: biotin/lipoyl-binding protein [Terriglobales bacterium]
MLAAAAALTLAGCNARAANPAPSPAALQRTVAASTIVQARPRLTTTLPAELSAFQDVQLQARVSGFIRELNADRGSQVKAGQLLATLDAPDLEAQRAEAEHRLGSARALSLEATAAVERDQATLDRLRGAAAASAGAVAGNDIHVAEQTVAADRAEVASREAGEQAAA